MKKKLLISVIVLAIVGIAAYGMLQSKNKVKVKVKCYYMAYACGDCFANYKIKEVIEGGNSIKEKLLVDRDIKVVFKTKELEGKIDTMTAKCAICYDYYIEGYLTFQSKKDYSLLEADTCIVKLRDPTCCEE